MRMLRLVNLGCLLAITTGFRPVTGIRWDVSKAQPNLWIELDDELYGADGFGDKVDDLKGMLEPLKDIPAADQRTEIWRLLMADFASVPTSYISLHLKPGQIDAIDESDDEVYDQTYADTHTISIKVGPSGSPASGFASLVTSGSRITGCNIVIAPRTLEDPQFFAHVLSHEILHCLGLEHQQDDADSLMSYSNNSVGLSIEERMALTQLYPMDPSYAKESPTFGLACEPAK